MENEQTPQPVVLSTPQQTRQSPYMIPGAIVIAGLLVAGAILFNGNSGSSAGGLAQVKGSDDVPSGSASLENMKPVSAADRILGNPDAPVKLVEYSDLECPFCKRFHGTVQQIVREYGASGKVAIVYRHFPLEQLHSKAPKEAEATECAAELGGNEKFWQYLDKIFEITPSNDGLDLAMLPKIAEQVGLNKVAFTACLDSGRHADHVKAQYDDAIAAGGNGTPYSVIVASNGKKFVVNGAQPYQSVKATIEQALKETK